MRIWICISMAVYLNTSNAELEFTQVTSLVLSDYGINNLNIGKKIVISPAIAVIFLLILTIFSNKALKSDRATLEEIVQVKFELYMEANYYWIFL